MKVAENRKKNSGIRSSLGARPSSQLVINLYTPLSNVELLEHIPDTDSDSDSGGDEISAGIIGELRSVEKRKEKNLDQTIEVLRARLASLKDAARFRLDLCHEDLNPNSKKTSKLAPRLTEEFEEGNPRIFRDKGEVVKDNLVSAEGVYIDPLRLVIRTKLMTEAGRKLEAKLGESFGMPNLREQKGKKNKASNRAARSKKSEARKVEIKKKKRQDLEKALQSNIESMVLRSVLEEDMDFKLPKHLNSFPIPVRWSADDPRSSSNDNYMDGVMDPELLLQYGLERITLPSGEIAFKKLLKKSIVHSYFVHLFWFIKVRFFQRGDCSEIEKYLLGLIGGEYVGIVDMVSQKQISEHDRDKDKGRSKEKASRQQPSEHEKDFIFKYFPYIVANAIYFSFYYLCPGARHLYTKSFRKQILLQVVQVLFGYQLCPISLKVNWAKLFPEEMLDDDEVDDSDQVGGMMTSGQATKPLSIAPSAGTSDARKTPQIQLLMSSIRASGGAPAGLLETDGDGPQRLSSSAPQLYAGTGNTGRTTGYDVDGTQAPLSRTTLLPPANRMSRATLCPRQMKEKLDASNISPVVQEFLGSSSSSGGKRSEVLRRTVPVGWCVAGGSDTHRKKVIPKQLHDELSTRVKELNALLHSQTSQCQRDELKSIRKINKNRMKILEGGPSSIGKFSLDLTKRRKNTRIVLDRDGDANGNLPYYDDRDDEEENDMHELYSL